MTTKDNPTPSEIRRKFQAGEDFNLANELQNQEFDAHYNRNRDVNGTIVQDRKKTKEEQRIEDEHAALLRRFNDESRALTDEELARQLQQEIDELEATEQIAKSEQLLEDEQLARSLMEQSGASSSANFNESQMSSSSNAGNWSQGN